MEMQLEGCHSANMSFSSAASNEPHQMQLSSMTSSSTLTSLSSSTPDTSSPPPIPPSPTSPSAPPPPATDPQQPQAESAHHSIAIPLSTPATPVAPLRRRPPSNYPVKKEDALKCLRDSIPHLMKLSRLLKSERDCQKEASSHKKLMRRHSKDLFNVVSMYAVLQGALFTAVGQSSIFTCADWWGPAGIVCMVTMGTLFSAVDKLRRMGYERQEVKKSERRQSAVYDKISELYKFGSFCQIESLEPAYEDIVFNNEAGSMCIFSVHGLLVLGFLLGFSALMMICCSRMLTCSPCRCKH